MADDKTIVTKKTAPKAAATTKKAAAKKSATTAGAAAPSTARKAAPATAAAPKTQMKPSAAPAKAAPVKPTPPAAPAKAIHATKALSAKEISATGRSKKTTATASTGAMQKSIEGKAISLKTLSNVSDEERLHMVHEAAYYRAEKRSFAPGHEAEDWAEAEREINELIASAKRISGR